MFDDLGFNEQQERSEVCRKKIENLDERNSPEKRWQKMCQKMPKKIEQKPPRK